MTVAKGLEKIEEIACHSSTWHEEQEPISDKPDKLCSILKNLKEVESDMDLHTMEVTMVQHSFKDPIDGRVTNLEKNVKKFIRDSDHNQRETQEII